MFSDFTPIKYILKAIEIIILYLALLFSGTGNALVPNTDIDTQDENRLSYLIKNKAGNCFSVINNCIFTTKDNNLRD